MSPTPSTMESQPQFRTAPQVAQPQGHTGRSPATNLMQLAGYVLRALIVVLTFISAIVMGVAKQTETAGSVKSGDSSAFIYFVVINVLAFLYFSVTMALSVLKRASSGDLALPFAVADLLMVVLLFSCNSAAAAISVVADQGINSFGWGKFCYIADKFCGGITASIVLSMFASVANLLLVLVAIIGLYKRS